MAETGLAASGYEELGLLSLSSGDYACLDPLLDDLITRHEGDKIAMSLPSLRTETMSPSLAEKIGRVRKTGFTLAPEAATERMRAVINKGNREADLLAAVDSIFRNGWSLLKLYFMIGLPEERDEDVVAIAELAQRCLGTARRALPKGQGSAAINLGASTFVPKPFTPFQWEPMIRPEETRRRQALITAALGGRHGAIQFKPHDSRQSSIEGALALGRPARRHRRAPRLPGRGAARQLDRVVRRGALAGRLRRVRAGPRRGARLLRPPPAAPRRGAALGPHRLRRHQGLPAEAAPGGARAGRGGRLRARALHQLRRLRPRGGEEPGPPPRGLPAAPRRRRPARPRRRCAVGRPAPLRQGRPAHARSPTSRPCTRCCAPSGGPACPWPTARATTRSRGSPSARPCRSGWRAAARWSRWSSTDRPRRTTSQARLAPQLPDGLTLCGCRGAPAGRPGHRRDPARLPLYGRLSEGFLDRGPARRSGSRPSRGRPVPSSTGRPPRRTRTAAATRRLQSGSKER